ncbi:MAG: class I SAM-dependent methyltransferase [Candidatus Hodarchaeales archaeon]|jgi:O-methyltransferase involved in polyketide biosynthesis
MEKVKVNLTGHPETLLIPLYIRAKESQRPDPLIKDEKAVEMVDGIDYDFSRVKYRKGTYWTTLMRVKRFDDYVRSFISDNPNGIVVSLGCGLDSRFSRVDNGKVEYYDLDFPDVIELRRKFFQETNRYHFIASSVSDFEWMDDLVQKNGPFLFIAEGLFMYLSGEVAKSLILKLQEKFQGCELIFDAFSPTTAKQIHKHPSLKKMGVKDFWGVNEGQELEEWNDGIEFLEEWFFQNSEDVKKLSIYNRLMFKMVGAISAGRKAHRFLRYRLS